VNTQCHHVTNAGGVWKGIGQLNPLELYKAIEPRYDTICEENNTMHFNSKRVMDDVQRTDISQWCTVKQDIQDYLPETNRSLDAGCGDMCRGTEGFDLQNGTSFKDALDIYTEGSFYVVTGYGSIHSAIGTKRLPWLQTTSNVKTEDPSVLWEDNPLVTLQQFTVDRGLIAFHLSCLAWWSNNLVGFTIRSRHCDMEYVRKLAKQFGYTVETEFTIDKDRYVNKLINIYNKYEGDERLTFLKKLYIIRNHYVNDPPIGMVWRKIND
jgi:hypothetical protein